MLKAIIYGMVYMGSTLMVYNIWCFVGFVRTLQRQKDWAGEKRVLYVPVALLVSFLLGYLAVGLFGKPDLIVSGILFGGSIFVTVMYWMLSRIIRRIQESERLEVQLQAAEESSRMKTSFLSSMSHEMRTPMNAIIGLTNLALKRPALDPETRDQLEKIGTSARHLLGLINDVLDMNRIESGRMELKREPFDFVELMDQISIIINSQCEEKGLAYHLEQKLPLDDYYIGDAMKLKQVLINILGNAVKFTHAPGSVRLSVSQQAAGDDARTLTFVIADTGIGMDSEYIERIFDAFSQEDATSTNRYGGSGLGMAIAKRIVEAMDGSIVVESEKGVGSVFTVRVTLGACDRVRESDEPEQEADGTLAALAGKRILMAEDVAINAEILRDLLEMEGMLCDHAVNGQDAVDRFRESPPYTFDAILMDMRMPVMNGLDATRAIRALDRPDAGTIPIIALTANAFEDDVRQTREAGMNAHLSKPVDPDLLYRTLMEQL